MDAVCVFNFMLPHSQKKKKSKNWSVDYLVKYLFIVTHPFPENF